MAVKLYILGAALIAISCFSVVSSSECDLFQFGKKDVIDRGVNMVLHSCPAVYDLSKDKEYCCYNFDRESYCCDTTGKLVNVVIMIVLAVIAVAIILAILSCIGLFLRSLFR